MPTISDWPLEVVVADIDELTPQIKGFVLQAADGAALPSFKAGAHIRVGIDAPGVPAQGLLRYRSYSLINSDGPATQYHIAVKLEAQGEGGSRFMHELQVGDRLQCSAPRQDFSLQDDIHHAVLIAGGIGITPILSMARTLTAGQASYELHYAARSPQLMAFREQTQAMCGGRIRQYFDDAEPSNGLSLAQILGAPSPDRHVYVCGPQPLIDAVIAIGKEQGWPSDHVHFELFGAPAPQARDGSCRVVLHRSGLTLDVPAGVSILDALIQAGVDPMFDCRRGECGVCALRVLSGTPEHRDYALSDSDRHEESLMCICVSRAGSAELVLDA